MPPFDTDVVADVKAAASLSDNMRGCVSAVAALYSLGLVRMVFDKQKNVEVQRSRRYQDEFVCVYAYGRK